MAKIFLPFRRIGVILLLIGLIVFPQLLNVFFPAPSTHVATSLARWEDHPDRLVASPPIVTGGGNFSQPESSLAAAGNEDAAVLPNDAGAAQVEQEAQAYQESLQSTDTPDAESGLTEAEIFTLEHQDVLKDQAAQEAAAYRESLQSTQAPQSNANFTELEMLQMERQKLLDEQARGEVANYEKSLQSTLRP